MVWDPSRVIRQTSQVHDQAYQAHACLAYKVDASIVVKFEWALPYGLYLHITQAVEKDKLTWARILDELYYNDYRPLQIEIDGFYEQHSLSFYLWLKAKGL